MTQEAALALLVELERTRAEIDDRLRDLITDRELGAMNTARLIAALRRRGRYARHAARHRKRLRHLWRGKRPPELS